MFQTIGSFVDSILLIGSGILVLTLVKKINKPYLKWLAIALILIGVILLTMDIIDTLK
jgi:membrane-bound ClpP family serine protease